MTDNLLRLCALVFLAAFSGCGSSVPALTPDEQLKLDPALQRLIVAASSGAAEDAAAPKPDNDGRYSVVARVSSPDELKKAGYEVSSVFGDIAVVHVTLEQVRSLAALPDVKSLGIGSLNQTQ